MSKLWARYFELGRRWYRADEKERIWLEVRMAMLRARITGG